MFGDRTAIHHGGLELSYAQLHLRACAFAHALRAAVTAGTGKWGCTNEWSRPEQVTAWH